MKDKYTKSIENSAKKIIEESKVINNNNKLTNNFYRKLKKSRLAHHNQNNTFNTIDSVKGSDELIKKLHKQQDFNIEKAYYSQHEYLKDTSKIDELLAKQTTRSFQISD